MRENVKFGFVLRKRARIITQVVDIIGNLINSIIIFYKKYISITILIARIALKRKIIKIPRKHSNFERVPQVGIRFKENLPNTYTSI